MSVFGEEDWVLEYWFDGGRNPQDLAVRFPGEHDHELDVPSAFTANVDQSYYEMLVDKSQRLAAAGRALFVDADGLQPAAVDGDDVLVDGAAYTPERWADDRPELFAVKSPDGGKEHAERVLWDGDTIVPVFEHGDDLAVNLVWGSYAERNAVSDYVDEYAVERLPASLNSAVLPLVEKDGDAGIAVFERGPGTGEYPDRHVVIAGGAPVMMRPDDVAWLESKEEARLLPDYGISELVDRGLIDDDEKICSGTMNGHDTYIVTEEDGARSYVRVPAKNMTMLGIVRDVNKTFAPEAIYVLDTGLPFGGEESEEIGFADNYVTGEEHADVAFVPLDALKETHDYVPTTQAAVSLLNIHLGNETLDDYTLGTPASYPSAETRIL